MQLDNATKFLLSSIDQIVQANVNAGKINPNSYSALVKCINNNANNIISDFNRCFSNRYASEGAIVEYAKNVVRDIYNSININNFNNSQGYSSFSNQPSGGGMSFLFSGNNNNNSYNVIDQTVKDAQMAEIVSNNYKEKVTQQMNGNIGNDNKVIETTGKEIKNVTNVKGVEYIGKDVNVNEIPSCSKNTIKVDPEDTEMYQITNAYTLTQNEVSRTKVVHITLKKAVYNLKEAVSNLRNARPDLFNANQYCIVMTYNKLTGYSIPNGGDIIFEKGDKFKNISKDATSMIQFTDRFEPALKQLPESIKKLVNKIYFDTFNIISEYYLWCDNDPNLFLNIHSWNRMGLFNTVQDVGNESVKEKILKFIEEMKSYGTIYSGYLFDIVKNTFDQTLCGENGFIDVRKDHKEYVPVMPNVTMTLDNRYFLRDLFIMPNEDKVRMLSLVARNYLLHQCEKTTIITNMRLSTSIVGYGPNVIVNYISELLNCIKEIIPLVGKTDLTVGYYPDNKNKPEDLARLGMNMSKKIKIKRIQ